MFDEDFLFTMTGSEREAWIAFKSFPRSWEITKTLTPLLLLKV
jgi:hypothetical protein